MGRVNVAGKISSYSHRPIREQELAREFLGEEERALRDDSPSSLYLAQPGVNSSPQLVFHQSPDERAILILSAFFLTFVRRKSPNCTQINIVKKQLEPPVFYNYQPPHHVIAPTQLPL